MMLGQPDAAFFEQVAVPYFRAIATWYQTMRLGITGKDVFQAVVQAFEGSPLRSSLNPGHLTSYDEWLSSPIRPDSDETHPLGDGLPVRHHPHSAAAGQADEL